ncbi:Ubiquitin-like domain-containing CTD phosphatase 1 [Chamberlinius hualienensis]
MSDSVSKLDHVIIKWGGKEYKINDLSYSETVYDLKKSVQHETGVLPERQKLLGLKVKGKPASDDTKLELLNIKPGTKILMVGSREEDIVEVRTQPTDIPEVIDDFDIEEEEVQTENREEFLAKVEKRIREYKINILSEVRVGKKLLVLDIDYTIFDHCSTAHSARELMRPYLHEFLTAAYEDYDIAIWSATSMKWIEVKMRELGVTSNPNYKIAFYLDSTAMINVHTPKYGLVEVENCQPSFRIIKFVFCIFFYAL